MIANYLELWRVVFSEEEFAQEESAYNELKNMFVHIPGVDTKEAFKVWSSVQTQHRKYLIKIWQEILKSGGDTYEKPRDQTKKLTFKWFDAHDINVFQEVHGQASIHKLKIEEWKKSSNQKTSNVRETLQVIWFFFVFVCYFVLFR